MVELKLKSGWLLIRKIFKYLLLAKLSFNKPVINEVLIFRGDGRNSQVFHDYLDWNYVEVLHQLDVEINVYILALSLVHRQSYYQEYVNCVKPKLFLTFIDNSTIFLKLKVKPGSVKVSVQNGYRSALMDLYDNLPKVQHLSLSLDYAFCMNHSVAEELSKYVKCKTIVIGSFISNKTEIFSKNNNIAYISQFRPTYFQPEKKITNSLSWGEFIKYEKEFLRWLFKYIEKAGLRLDILGSSPVDQQLEESYYNELADGCNFNFVKKDENRPTYKLIDEASSIVAIDSTLGYEALSRGAKVAMFAGIRGSQDPFNTKRFGWPGPVSEKGIFWTNSTDYRDWEKVIKYVTEVTLDNWHIDCDSFIQQVMERDFGNIKFLTLMKKIQSPLKAKST